MANLLSIDLDIIMAPSIQLYNDIVDADAPYNKEWTEIYAHRRCQPYMKVDEDIIQHIITILNHPVWKDKTVFLSDDHTNIICMIDEMHKHGMPSNNLTITNIDHHHDLSYNENQLRDIDVFDYPSCGCWAGYLQHLGLLKNYYWLHDVNAEMPIIDRFKMSEITWADLDDTIECYDGLFVCTSFAWIPPDCQNRVMTILKAIFDNVETNAQCMGAPFAAYAKKIEWENLLIQVRPPQVVNEQDYL